MRTLLIATLFTTLLLPTEAFGLLRALRTIRPAANRAAGSERAHSEQVWTVSWPDLDDQDDDEMKRSLMELGIVRAVRRTRSTINVHIPAKRGDAKVTQGHGRVVKIPVQSSRPTLTKLPPNARTKAKRTDLTPWFPTQKLLAPARQNHSSLRSRAAA